MDRSKILAIGCGGCGNNQTDVLLSIDRRYSGIFMNTNLSEMESLQHFDRTRNCFYIPNADGTGKDRDLSEKYMKEEAPKFAEMIKKYINQTTIYFLSSFNGGTGSKAMIMLSKIVKRFCPEKSLNILGTMPSLNELEIDYNNAIDTWNEVVDLMNKGIVDTVQLIDNNISDDKNEINFRAMKEFDDGFNTVGGSLDASDSSKAHHSKGYKVILKLNNRASNTKAALDKAMNDSPFYIPENLDCDVMIGNINANKFDIKNIQHEIKAYEFIKFNESDKDDVNTIVLGGCEMPKEAIELVQEALKEIQQRKTLRYKKKEQNVIIEKDNHNNKHKEDNKNVSSKLSSKEINDVFADDSFWDN